jgi:hypothetical protein
MASNSGNAFYQPGSTVQTSVQERRALRSYETDSLNHLRAMYEHVNALVIEHRLMIPGGLCLSMEVWRDHLRKVIAERTEPGEVPEDAPESEGDEPEDRYVEIQVKPCRE